MADNNTADNIFIFTIWPCLGKTGDERRRLLAYQSVTTVKAVLS